MTTFRKKPILIEATQYIKDGPRVKGIFYDDRQGPYCMTIHNQRAYVVDGDWIITEPDGAHH